MTACVGWEGEDGDCPLHGQFHGCALPDGHTGRHVCACQPAEVDRRRRARNLQRAKRRPKGQAA